MIIFVHFSDCVTATNTPVRPKKVARLKTLLEKIDFLQETNSCNRYVIATAFEIKRPHSKNIECNHYP